MKERPIIMSAESVQAILDGRKTQTRRVIKTNMVVSKSDGCKKRVFNLLEDLQEVNLLLKIWQKSNLRRLSEYGQISNKLWVKEGFEVKHINTGYQNPSIIDDFEEPFAVIKYADGIEMTVEIDEKSKLKKGKKSALFMPRSASRITLEITNIRVERLQDMSISDYISEGVDHMIGLNNNGCRIWTHEFKKIWDKLNAKRGYSWDSNPFVWVIEFKRVEQ